WNGRMPRVLAVIVVELVFLLAVLSVLLLVVPVMAKEIPLMRQQMPVLLDRLNDTMSPWMEQFGIPLSLDLPSLKAQVADYLNANWEDAFPSLLSSLKLGGSVALAVIGNAVLIPVALF